MRRSVSILAVIGAVAANHAAAHAQFYQQRSAPTVQAAPFHHITGGTIAPPLHGSPYTLPKAPPAAAPANQAAAAPIQVAPSHHHHHSNYGYGFGYGGYYPGSYYGGGYYPFVWTGAYTPAYAPLGYPYLAANNLGAGLAVGMTPPPAQRALPIPRANNAPNFDDAPLRAVPRPTSPDQKAKAGKLIGYGDTYFNKQKYLPALERYKSAAQIAPDLADTYMRQGHALVALGLYENAAKAFRRGLRIREDWSDSNFKLDQIYGDDRIAKTTHLENLAKAVEANAHDPDLLLVLGVELYFDGQRERADVVFTRAEQLGANEDQSLDGFVAKPQKPADNPAPRAGKAVF